MIFDIMESKRKFFKHCREFVMLRTHALHADLYCHKSIEEVCSSEEEEIVGNEPEDQKIEATSQGTRRVMDKNPMNIGDIM